MEHETVVIVVRMILANPGKLPHSRCKMRAQSAGEARLRRLEQEEEAQQKLCTLHMQHASQKCVLEDLRMAAERALGRQPSPASRAPGFAILLPPCWKNTSVCVLRPACVENVGCSACSVPHCTSQPSLQSQGPRRDPSPGEGFKEQSLRGLRRTGEVLKFWRQDASGSQSKRRSKLCRRLEATRGHSPRASIHFKISTSMH